ncbi:MAG: PD-(D/E)XK nuclease-like domain-containing protein [Planctomycetota bacterium]
MEAPEPGIYPGIPFDEYREWDAVNNTMLGVLADKSPLHAKEYHENPPEPTEAFSFGSALHTRILECDKFPARYIVAPKVDRRTKAGKEAWAAFEKTAEGKDIISDTDYETIQAIAASLEQHAINSYVRDGQAEVCIVWIDKDTGLLCKARLDYVHPQYAFLIDVKTTRDASPEGFAKALWNYRYYQQCAWYLDGWLTITQEENGAFVFVAAEKTPPYAVAAYEMHEDVIRAGRKAYRAALDTYKHCLETDVWPSYSASVEMMNLPTWALQKAGVGRYEMEVA